MSDLKITLKVRPWSCECCGYGNHFRILITDRTGREVWSGSIDDQFGGKLNKEDKEEIRGVEVPEDYAEGIRKGLEILGETVELEVEYN